jgi:two-component system sensor histidine kinase YesM
MKLRALPVGKRMFFMFLTLSIIPILAISIPMNAISTRNVSKKVDEYCIQIINGLKTCCDGAFEQINVDMVNVIYDQNVQLALYDTLGHNENITQYDASNMLREELLKKVVLINGVTRATIYIDSQEITIFSEDSGASVIGLQDEMDFRTAVEAQRGRLVWDSLCDGYNQGQGKPSYKDQSPVLKVGRRFSLLKSGSPLGIITLWYNNNQLKKLNQQVDVAGEYYILDNAGYVLFSSGGDSTCTPFKYLSILESDEQVIRLKETDEVMTQSKSDVNGFRYVHIQPYSELITETAKYTMLLAALCVLLIAFSGVAASIYAKSIIMPINNIQRGLKKVIKDGDFDYRVRDLGKDELACLANDLDSMTYQLKNTIDENYMMKISENRFKLLALKSQINPHFMFNTLDDIRWIARKNKDFEVSKRLKLLSQILRSVLTEDEMIIPIEQEIRNTKSYLALQTESMRGKLIVNWNIDRSVLKYKMQMLILQPLVENSIFHGMKSSVPLTITIEIKGVDDWICIVVEDDGRGMSAEKINEIFKENYGDDHIGLRNVKNRILSYFENSRFSLVSEEGKGTRVEICVPKRMDQEVE